MRKVNKFIKLLTKYIIFAIFIILASYKRVENSSPNILSLSFVGDLFLQRQLFNSYYEHKENKYYFPEKIFTDINEYVNKDFSFIVIDTPVASNISPPSGYPLYNAPVEILDTLKKIGFNVMITSGNHSLDKGEKGLIETIKNIKRRGLFYVGTNLSKDEKFLILEKNHIKIGVLAYTFSTNGIPLPKGKEYLVNLIDKSIIKKDIQIIKNLCDFIIVYLHWGNIEYIDEVEEDQKNLAKGIIDWGADIIIGSHPHAIKPFEKINNKLCFYSLGNFFADQYGLKIPEVKFGLILNLTISKFNKKVHIIDYKTIPVFIWRQSLNKKYEYKVIKAEKVTNLSNIEIKDKLYYNKVRTLLRIEEDLK